MAATTQAVGGIVTSATALSCVRTGRIQQHREWMMRRERGFVSVVWSVIAVAQSERAYGLLQDLVGCRLDVFTARERGLLQRRAVGHGHGNRTHATHRRSERAERLGILNEQRGNLRCGRARRGRLVY